MAVVSFDYALWSARYPELAATTSEGLATAIFTDTPLYLSNADDSPVQDVNVRRSLLNMLVAHLAAINAMQAGVSGRISSVKEGDVTIAFEYNGTNAQAWYAQTRYGAAFWEATKAFRAFSYVPGPAPYQQVPGFGFNRWPA